MGEKVSRPEKLGVEDGAFSAFGCGGALATTSGCSIFSCSGVFVLGESVNLIGSTEDVEGISEGRLSSCGN